MHLCVLRIHQMNQSVLQGMWPFETCPSSRRTTSTVVLEYSSEGRVVATGHPYGNRYNSVVVIKDRKVTEWRDCLDPLRVFAALDGRSFEPDGNAATDPGDG
jgi:hypothetical protein